MSLTPNQRMLIALDGGMSNRLSVTYTAPHRPNPARVAGRNGGYILCPSDNFFEADSEPIKVFADEPKRCIYPAATNTRTCSCQT